MEILKYKEFEGSAELDIHRGVCRGRILFIDDVVTYESESIKDLQKQFEEAVDDYIETCRLIEKEPQKSCRGQFNVRVTPEMHRAAARRAIADDTSLNDVVCKALDAYLSPVIADTVRLDKIFVAFGQQDAQPMTNEVVRLAIPLGSATTMTSVVPATLLGTSPALPLASWKATGSAADAQSDQRESRYAH